MPHQVRVAIVDSGVHAAHPHVQGVAGGVAFDADGRPHDDFVDRLGHGTAVTAAIREKAPDALVYAVRVFDRALTTSGRALAAACDWAIDARVDLINLSLGTQNPGHEGILRDIVARARDAGVLIVAAGEQDGIRWLPGSLPGVVSVTLDWTLSRDVCRARLDEAGDIHVHATGYPRPIEGVPPERNLKGLSFAVANVTGLLAAVVAGRSSEADAAAAARDAVASGWLPPVEPP